MKESLIKMFVAYICIDASILGAKKLSRWNAIWSKSIEKSWVDFLHVKLIFQVITFI